MSWSISSSTATIILRPRLPPPQTLDRRPVPVLCRRSASLDVSLAITPNAAFSAPSTPAWDSPVQALPVPVHRDKLHSRKELLSSRQLPDCLLKIDADILLSQAVNLRRPCAAGAAHWEFREPLQPLKSPCAPKGSHGGHVSGCQWSQNVLLVTSCQSAGLYLCLLRVSL